MGNEHTGKNFRGVLQTLKMPFFGFETNSYLNNSHSGVRITLSCIDVLCKKCVDLVLFQGSCEKSVQSLQKFIFHYTCIRNSLKLYIEFKHIFNIIIHELNIIFKAWSQRRFCSKAHAKQFNQNLWQKENKNFRKYHWEISLKRQRLILQQFQGY